MVAFDPMILRDGITEIRGKFTTHAQYAFCVERLFDGLIIEAGEIRNRQPTNTARVSKFIQLATLTHNGIESDLNICAQDGDYARVAAPWLIIKSYYTIYYLEAVALHLFDSNEVYFGNGGHVYTIKGIKALMISNRLRFSHPEVNCIHTHGELRAHILESGENQRNTFHQTERCSISLCKMLAKYPEDNYKKSIGAEKGYYGKLKIGLRDRFYANQAAGINVTEYFYWMRIKVNYKDATYLDPTENEEISPAEINSYINSHVNAYRSYRGALLSLIDNLANQRGLRLD